MNAINLFYFFGIIPYQYNPVHKCYAAKRAMRNAFQMLWFIIAPTTTMLTLGVLIRELLFRDVRFWRVVYILRLFISVITLFVNISDNYYNAKFHMELLNFCTRSCAKTASKISQKTMKKITVLLSFYIYYQANQYTFVVLYNEELDELFFFVTYYYLEMVLILNMFYIACLFTAMQELMNNIINMRNRDQSKLYGQYLRQKTLLTKKMSFRLVQLTTNTYVVSSALIFIFVTQLQTFPHGILEANVMSLGLAGSVIQLVGLFSVCYEAHQCANQEQELARKLSDLRENFAQNNKESPSTTMTKISVLYRPPAISAYGLFEINLNFFYQMIAAIFTQCVILFQFQSFEQQ
uniref:gustatory receptor 74 isoform Gr74 n=1 Tax=Aedes aegypti TaxID=7159 RepID=UPI000C1E7DE9|nr:gustatory receptor 74 isoform Gr74 [Aedes aegypti]